MGISTTFRRLLIGLFCGALFGAAAPHFALAESAPPDPSPTCPPSRPTSTAVTGVYYNGNDPATHQVITLPQIAFDLCRAAWSISPEAPPPKKRADPLLAFEDRMDEIAVEAHLLIVCPSPLTVKDVDWQTNILHNWGCGPFDKVAVVNVGPAPQYSFTCPPAKPWSTEGTHPPINRDQMIQDLCSEAALLASPNHPDVVVEEQRIVHLATLAHLLRSCTWKTYPQGRSDYPPAENDLDFAVKRKYGCGPYPKS